MALYHFSISVQSSDDCIRSVRLEFFSCGTKHKLKTATWPDFVYCCRFKKVHQRRHQYIYIVHSKKIPGHSCTPFLCFHSTFASGFVFGLGTVIQWSISILCIFLPVWIQQVLTIFLPIMFRNINRPIRPSRMSRKFWNSHTNYHHNARSHESLHDKGEEIFILKVYQFFHICFQFS